MAFVLATTMTTFSLDCCCCRDQPTDRHIYERGCLRAMEDWLESHLLMVASSTCSVMIIQVVGMDD